MSKMIQTRWSEPLTSSGINLDKISRSIQSSPFRLHEAGWFKMGEDWHYQSVHSPFWRLYYNALSGASIISSGKRWPLHPRQMLLVPAGVTYDCQGHPGLPHLWMHFSHSDWSPESPLNILPIALHSGLRILIKELSRDLRKAKKEEASPPALHSLAYQSLSVLHLAWASLPLAKSPPLSARMTKVLRAMSDSLSSPTNITALAQEAGMTPGSFARWFRSQTGSSPVKFLLDRRLHEAARLLRYSDETIDSIAEATGFADRFHFSHQFSRRYGKGPASFRMT